MYKIKQDEEGYWLVVSPCGDILKTFQEDCYYEAERFMIELNEYYGYDY